MNFQSYYRRCPIVHCLADPSKSKNSCLIHSSNHLSSGLHGMPRNVQDVNAKGLGNFPGFWSCGQKRFAVTKFVPTVRMPGELCHGEWWGSQSRIHQSRSRTIDIHLRIWTNQTADSQNSEFDSTIVMGGWYWNLEGVPGNLLRSMSVRSIHADERLKNRHNKLMKRTELHTVYESNCINEW